MSVMICRGCKNTYLAAKKGHLGCIAQLHEWHPRTLCGAVVHGDKFLYYTIRDIDNGRTNTHEVALEAALCGWVDILAENYTGPYTISFVYKLLKNALLSKSVHMCEFIFTNYVLTHNLSGKYGHLLAYAIRSKSVRIIQWFEDTFGWYEDYIHQNTGTIFDYVIRTDDTNVLNYMWSKFDVQRVRIGGMYHWYPESSMKCMNSFAFLVEKCNQLHIIIDPELKERAICYPKNAEFMIKKLYENNHDWGPYFKDALEDELHDVGPRERPIYERIRDFARVRGLYGNIPHILSKLKDIIGDTPLANQPIDIHPLMNHIENMNMPEGKYIEACALMKKLYDLIK